MDQNSLNGRIGLYGMTTVVLGYMLIDVVKAFIIGGEGAPDIWVLLASLVVMGGGAAFGGVNLFKMFKLQKALKAQQKQEAEEAAEVSLIEPVEADDDEDPSLEISEEAEEIPEEDAEPITEE